MKTVIGAGIALVGVALLAGCGAAPGQRTAGGAGTGAVTGAVLGAVAGPVGAAAGAAAGAGAGALTASFTTPEQIDLGEPPWEIRDSAGAPWYDPYDEFGGKHSEPED